MYVLVAVGYERGLDVLCSIVGLWSAGAGVLTGVASLVAAPIVGAQQGGASGFVKGLGVGVVSAAVSACLWYATIHSPALSFARLFQQLVL